MSEIKFARAEEHIGRVPEVLTEAQDLFVNFVMRHAQETDEEYIDCFDMRRGILRVDASDDQLIPVDEIEVESRVSIDRSDGELLLPHNERSVSIRSLVTNSELILGYNAVKGWYANVGDGNFPVDEAYATRVTLALLTASINGMVERK